jgi:Uma2 family endonuclease
MRDPRAGCKLAVMTAYAAPSPATDSAERRFVLHGVPWSTYVALRDGLDTSEHANVRMTYLDGYLELMSPSTLHEDAKTIIARLIEVWATELDVDLRGFGNATFRAEAKRGGLEPDECYVLGALPEGGVPAIAIEVEVTNPLVDKLEVYARLGVREVWVWSGTQIVVHCLAGGAYETNDASRVLPSLDVAALSAFVRPGESQTKLARAYRDSLRAK